MLAKKNWWDCSNCSKGSFKILNLAWNFTWKFHETSRESFNETSRESFTWNFPTIWVAIFVREHVSHESGSEFEPVKISVFFSPWQKKVTRDISVWKLSRVTGRVTGYFFGNCHGLSKTVTGYFFRICHGLHNLCHGLLFTKFSTIGNDPL